MDVLKVELKNNYWDELIKYANQCSWIAGKHLSDMLINNVFQDWEAVFIAVENEKIIGYCTFMKTDYYPENKYYPWISSIFVDELHRGKHVSELMINKVITYAGSKGFNSVYIPSDIEGLYEKYGFTKIDSLINYGGDIDNVFRKEIILM